jgi:hypothetical protein
MKLRNLSNTKIVLLLWGLFVVFMFIYMGWLDHVFNQMSPAQHLEAAESGIRFGEAMKHLDAIPPNAPEATKVPDARERLKAKEQSNTKEIAARIRITNSEAAAVVELEKDLRNRGYDLKVSGSDTPDEVVITSSDFADTDHRVQFLSAMRSKYSGPACWAGFRTVRLRSSSIPLVGFSESYSMECMN